VQDVLAKAIELWPSSGTPANPAGWIYVAARRRAADAIRRRKRWIHPGGPDELDGMVLGDPVTQSVDDGSLEIPDERLRLIFMCCHPALNQDSQVALTLRMLCGLSTAEIAAAFLLHESTLAQRLVRAKRKIRDAAIPFEYPAGRRLADRLASVLGVVYLVFNEGYFSGSDGSVIRTELCEEAIGLARLLSKLMPDEPEIVGLLALLILQHSRRDARQEADGSLILLDDQDRSLWHDEEIEEGCAMVRVSLRRGRIGPYQVQAAIAALHAEAKLASATDWSQISALYLVLSRMTPSPVIELNRAVAVSMAEGPERGLQLVDEPNLAEALAEYRWYHTTRARLLEKLGRSAEAIASYETALALVSNPSEESYIRNQILNLDHTRSR